VKKILIGFIISLFLFWGIWLVFPKNVMQSIIEDSLSSDKLTTEIEDFRKGLFYTLHAGKLTLLFSKGEKISLDNIIGNVNPLNLIFLRLNISFNGNIGEGAVSGHIKFIKKRTQMEIKIQNTEIEDMPMFQTLGVTGKGKASGTFSMQNNTGHVEFDVKDAQFEQANFSSVTVPLQFFHSMRGSVDIKGKIKDIVSIALEGKDIRARMKGSIRDSFMDAAMEVMPGLSFVENPIFTGQLEKYKVSPGYYVIPVKGTI
jgi:type II secretion system protein N